MDKALAYVKKLNEEQKDVHVTMTHVMAHAAAWGLYKMRRDVGRLPFGFFKKSKKHGVTILVDVQGGRDLIPLTVWDAHEMTIFELAKSITDRVSRAKTGDVKSHNKQTAAMKFVPSFIAQPMMFVLSYLAAQLGFSFKPLGLKADSFGHIVITNVGTLGYTSAAAPICPVVHAMAYICTGAIQKRACVDDDDKIVVKKVMTAVATGDHRFGDAAIYIPFFKTFIGYIQDPSNFDEKTYKANQHYSEKKEA